jgi:hypothetical protein
VTSGDRWQEIKRISADALERPKHERAAFLQQACTDPELRSQVEQLLRSCEQADAAEGFLSGSAPSFAAPLVGHVDAAASGTVHGATAELRAALAGRYTVSRELGRGGMATVYLARDSSLRDPKCVGRFALGQSAEEPALHDTRLLGIESAEPFQCFIQRDQCIGALGDRNVGLIERDWLQR